MLFRALVRVEPESVREKVSRALQEAGVQTLADDGGRSLWSELERGRFDLLVATPGSVPSPWTATAQRLRGLPAAVELVAVVDPARADERRALEAVGAFASLDADLDATGLRKACESLLLRLREVVASRLRRDQGRDSRVADLATRSPAMRKLLDLAHRVAAADTTLLLLGETGVGKEWLARSVHAGSPRAGARFLPFNCAAVPDSLIESELFGHEAGAFTGAARARRGAFEMAHRGTLLLDEIGDLPLHLQGKLLRVLQSDEIQRLGAERPIPVDVRILAATNRDLQSEMEKGTFRQDLFYRLSVVTLRIPPLRERREDIRPLAVAYLDYFQSRLGRPRLQGFREASLAALERHAWPGNVRELVNAVERAVLLSDGEWIEPDDLVDAGRLRSRTDQPAPIEGGYQVADTDLDRPLLEATRAVVDRFERHYLESLLRGHGGRMGETARRAGIDVRTLYNKLKKHGLDRAAYRDGSDAARDRPS